MNQNAVQQVRDLSLQTSGNRKETSLVSKLHGVELPSWVLHEPDLRYVMEHWIFLKKNGILNFFQKGNGLHRSIVVGNV